MADLRPLREWSGSPGTMVQWLPDAATLASVHLAPASPIPPSYEQEQHLHTYRACELHGQEMVRLVIVTWRIPGRCETSAMTQVINAHLRRHDTYHSWFRYQDDGSIVRHVIDDPSSLHFVPTEVGEVSAPEWREHVAGTPGPLEWDCFRFGVVQHEDSFTFFGSVDHLHADASLIPILFHEIHQDYRAVVEGAEPRRLRPAARYLDYCARQRERAAALTPSDAAVVDWVDFLHRNNCGLPRFPLPLGDTGALGPAEHVTVGILDPAETAQFKSACAAAGARIIGGLLACAALSERELTGSGSYSVFTPVTTRKTAEEFRTNGWFVGVLPVSIDLIDDSFEAAALAAQRCFDERGHLADIPLAPVLQLAGCLPTPDASPAWPVMLSYVDAHLPPMNARSAKEWFESNGSVYLNPGVAGQVSLWFCRTPFGLSLTAAYPANATARASIARYIDACTETCRRVAACASAITAAAD
jgi:mycolipenoyl-CoA---2-(long-chain-fatty acyl)-trehalose mycolipenoyltransferase / long-chain-acyl-CoA---trehalose acyltransferase